MTPAYDDGSATVFLGDVGAVLPHLPSNSVDCVVTSPPYWALRDYGVDGQLGLEPTPEAYVRTMVEVFREVRRILKPTGTLWLNMGDCYAAQPNGNNGLDRSTLTGDGEVIRRRRGQGASPRRYTHPHDGDIRTFRDKPFSSVVSGLKPKDLVGLPWLLAFALRADGWWLRSDIVWSKPNPMPESVTDRPTKSHEYLFLLSKSATYFYDAEAIKEPSRGYTKMPDGWDTGPGGHGSYHRNGREKGARSDKQAAAAAAAAGNGATFRRQTGLNDRWDESQRNGTAPLSRNKRSVWTIATQPYPDAHFATFPEDLVKPCILAGTSERGCCAECGKPWERNTSVTYDADGRTTNGPRSVANREITAGFAQRQLKRTDTIGWRRTCRCNTDETAPAVVLDPFAGSGTTLAVAKLLGRCSIGVELNPEYLPLMRKRLQQDVFAFTNKEATP